jgi:hypothetical protein
MIEGQKAACELTGFVIDHADACEKVANRMGCIILFREPGLAAQGLIAESYGMKGFRIDTKSCNWGPMSGFVCVDPRLSKRRDGSTSYAARNREWTKEALDPHGHINTKFFATPSAEERLTWVADTMPIVLSQQRIEDLTAGRAGLSPVSLVRNKGGSFSGVSEQTFTGGEKTVTLPWRLVPAGQSRAKWLKGAAKHYVLCVDRSPISFQQEYPEGATPVPFTGPDGDSYEAILGMINPGTKERGFKACITADYDLFSIWPSGNDAMGGMHKLTRILGIDGGQGGKMPAGVPRTSTVDTRQQADGEKEHYRFGDVSPRVMTIKTLLNTAIMAAGYQGGNAIHHNDEAGNFALAKGSLAECLPLIAFVPPIGDSPGGTKALQSVGDFGQLVREARAGGYQVVAKPEWLKEAGIVD